jgi:hypothetical protein
MFEWITDRLYKSEVVETPEEDPRETDDRDSKPDISIAKLEDDGSLYLICLDWDRKSLQNTLEHTNLIDELELALPDSSFQILQGQLGGDIEVVETSVAEVFERDEE